MQYTYTATKDTYYHATGSFTAKDGPLSKVTVQTGDWLTELALSKDNLTSSKGNIPLDQTFDPASHAYTAAVADTPAAVYLCINGDIQTGSTAFLAQYRTITNTAVYELPATNLSPARELKTTNQLIDDSTSNSNYYSRAIGIKTGYTSKAGRCVISCAKGDGMYFLAVVCGAATTVLDTGDVRMESFPQCIRLFQYGFDQFSYVSIVSPLYPLAQITVNNSAASQVVSLAPAEEIRLLLPKDYDPQLLLVEPVPVSQSIDAPVYSGQVLGSVTVSYDGETLGTTDLLAINDVAKSDFNATVSGASSYIQKNWWKWVVFVIVLMLAGGVVFLIYLQLRKRQERQARMERRRKALEHRRRQQEDEPYGCYDDSNE